MAPSTENAPSGTRQLRKLAVVLGGALVAVASLVLVPASPASAAQNETVNPGVVAQISYAPNSYIIGNAYAGWTDRIQGPGQFASGPGNPNGAYYRWGHLFGPNFNSCAWIPDGEATATGAAANDCGDPQQIDTPHFAATYTNGTVSPGAGDGNATTRTGAADCGTGYGNVEPWRVPATPGNPRALAGTDTLLWRYVTKDGNWVMVRDTAATNPGDPNWFFVPRDCVSF